MTKPLSILVGAGEIGPLADAVTEVIGAPLVRRDLETGALYRAVAFCTEFLLYGNHGMDDDSGIPYSAYAYHLQCIPLRAALETSEFGALYESLVLFLAARLSKVTNSRCLVLVNLQRRLAEYDSGQRR